MPLTARLVDAQNRRSSEHLEGSSYERLQLLERSGLRLLPHDCKPIVIAVEQPAFVAPERYRGEA